MRWFVVVALLVCCSAPQSRSTPSLAPVRAPAPVPVHEPDRGAGAERAEPTAKRAAAHDGVGASRAPIEVEQQQRAKSEPAGASEGFGQPLVPREETVVRVLLYHTIGTYGPRRGVSTSDFRKQLHFLEENQVEVIRLSQLLDFLDGKIELPRHAAVITIDDGEISSYSIAFRELRRKDWPFALGIATEAIDEHEIRGAVDWDQIREMIDSGLCEVASHSITHRAMTSLPDEVARRELDRSAALLQEALGRQPEAFFYPLGAQDRRIRRLTKQSGYRAAFVAHGGPTIAGTPRFGVPRYDVGPGVTMRKFRSFFNHEIRMLSK